MFVDWILLFVLIVASAIASTTDYQPQQVHIAFGGKVSLAICEIRTSQRHSHCTLENLTENTNAIVVTWSTMSDTDDSIVKYETNGVNSTAIGSSELFTDGGKKRRTQYIHRVHFIELHDLKI